MVSPLTLPQVKSIITAAGIGPHAERDQALVAFLAATGMKPETVRSVAYNWHLTRLDRPREVVEVMDCGGYLERRERLVRLPSLVRNLLTKARPSEGVYVFGKDATGMIPMTPAKIRRVVARCFVAAGLPPQRAAARLREAFFRLSQKWSPERPTLLPKEDLADLRFHEPQDEPKAPAREKSRGKTGKPKRGPRRPAGGGKHAQV